MMIKKYLGIFVTLFLISAIGFSVYEQLNKPKMSAKSKRIPCQIKTTTYERVLQIDQIKEGQKLLLSGNYKIKSKIWKSKYSTSKLFNHISKEQIDTLNHQHIHNISTEKTSSNKILEINFYTRENDPDDPGKHGTECKLYAGYLVYEFKLDGKLIYKIQTDFMDFQGKDIANRISCVYNSFLTIK